MIPADRFSYQKIILMSAQRIIPAISGTATDIAVHFTLFVSFQIVSSVVEHGKWNIEKTQVHIAVVTVHPLSTRMVFRLSSEE